ncbi:MAG: sialate O-acetylesterase [Chthoniobacter sp.]|nr:sialate O-acetylesterase [Chthoniobacter sp.]
MGDASFLNMITVSCFSRRGLVVSLLAVVAVLLASPASAVVRLPRVIGSDMVLQREVEVPVWGWAAPGESVTCELGQAKVTAVANAQGEWMVKLPPLPAGGPFAMEVRGQNTLKLTGILVGEVWVCSGQSNMEMGVAMAKDAKQEVAAAAYPQIRLFLVPKKTAGRPQPDVEATWRECSPTSIAANFPQAGWGGFSAVAYYFGRELHQTLKVPIGLIESSWGGTRIEPWTPPSGFAAVPALKAVSERVEQANTGYVKSATAAIDQLETAIANARKALASGGPLPAIPVLNVRHPLEGNADPVSLYNGMIHPLVPFAIRGAIWYQGESNNGEGMQYFEKMKALVGGWRQVWKQGDFPFYYVQIAPYKYGVAPTQLPAIWNAQLAALSIPNTGMAVTTDIATLNDIHPPNKQDVGKRLALWALARTYGKKEYVFSGPLYRSMTIEGGKIVLSFDHLGTGLDAADDLDLTHFEIAGEDGKFFAAKAVMVGEHVVVSADTVPAPKNVRFGWDQLARPNLANKEGFPASPFNTTELPR